MYTLNHAKNMESSKFFVYPLLDHPGCSGWSFSDILRCPTITEIIDGEEVTRPVNMDTCQEPREVKREE